MMSLEERMAAAFGLMMLSYLDPDYPNVHSLKEMMDALAIDEDIAASNVNPNKAAGAPRSVDAVETM